MTKYCWAAARDDGHLWILPMIQSAPFDTARDFAPVMLIASTPSILVTHPSLPVKTVRDVIGLAKSKPGQLDYASGATGSGSQHCSEAAGGDCDRGATLRLRADGRMQTPMIST